MKVGASGLDDAKLEFDDVFRDNTPEHRLLRRQIAEQYRQLLDHILRLIRIENASRRIPELGQRVGKSSRRGGRK